MFVVTDTYTFSRPIDVMVPVAGGHEKQQLKGTFRVMPSEELDALDFGSVPDATRFLKGVIVSLDDLVDGAKQPVPYSDTIRDQLLQFNFVRRGLIDAYFAAINKAAEGN